MIRPELRTSDETLLEEVKLASANLLELLDRSVVIPAAPIFSRNDLFGLRLECHGLVCAANPTGDRYNFRAVPNCDRWHAKRFYGHFLSFFILPDLLKTR